MWTGNLRKHSESLHVREPVMSVTECYLWNRRELAGLGLGLCWQLSTWWAVSGCERQTCASMSSPVSHGQKPLDSAASLAGRQRNVRARPRYRRLRRNGRRAWQTSIRSLAHGALCMWEMMRQSIGLDIRVAATDSGRGDEMTDVAERGCGLGFRRRESTWAGYGVAHGGA